jgi:hypothetical protein
MREPSGSETDIAIWRKQQWEDCFELIFCLHNQYLRYFPLILAVCQAERRAIPIVAPSRARFRALFIHAEVKEASGSAPRRHPEWPPYRCFLSDLTGFGGLRCAGPTRTSGG